MLRTQVKVQRFRAQLQQSGSCGAEAAVQEQSEIRPFTGRDSQRGPQLSRKVARRSISVKVQTGVHNFRQREAQKLSVTHGAAADVRESHVSGTGRNGKITQDLRAARETGDCGPVLEKSRINQTQKSLVLSCRKCLGTRVRAGLGGLVVLRCALMRVRHLQAGNRG